MPVSVSSGFGTETFFLESIPIFFNRSLKAGISSTVIAIWLTMRSSSGWTQGLPKIKCRSTFPNVNHAPCLFLSKDNVISLCPQHSYAQVQAQIGDFKRVFMKSTIFFKKRHIVLSFLYWNKTMCNNVFGVLSYSVTEGPPNIEFSVGFSYR